MIAVICRRRAAYDDWLRTMAYHDRSQFHFLMTAQEAREMEFAGVVRVGDDWFERWNAREMYDEIMAQILGGGWS